MQQPRDTDWLNGYKNKTHIYAADKRPTSDLETHTDWKQKDGKGYSMWMETKRNSKWKFLFQTKIDFKEYYKRQRRILHND